MDPGSIAATALGTAASSVASKGIEKAQDRHGIKGLLTIGAFIISVLALIQAVRTKSFRGITGWH